MDILGTTVEWTSDSLSFLLFMAPYHILDKALIGFNQITSRYA